MLGLVQLPPPQNFQRLLALLSLGPRRRFHKVAHVVFRIPRVAGADGAHSGPQVQLWEGEPGRGGPGQHVLDLVLRVVELACAREDERFLHPLPVLAAH